MKKVLQVVYLRHLQDFYLFESVKDGIILNYLSANNPQQNDEYDRYQPFFTGAPVKKRSSPHVGNSSLLISVFL